VDLDTVTVGEALNHPNWDMGRKVTIDSATLMNKGLETMECCWLFDMPIDKVEVIIHPESIVHSMVEFMDGSILAQLSLPDMRFAIQCALTYPDRLDSELPVLSMTELGALHFMEPDVDRFPCLRLARVAAKHGGSMPAVLNATNEVAVELFLNEEIPFSGIWKCVERVMEHHDIVADPTLEQIVEADAWARRAARSKL
jgi:1-deoxy-D-xylulose-5-phosphate reductoisomerase